MTHTIRRTALALLCLTALGEPAAARELANFDINAAQAKRAGAGSSVHAAPNADAIGRATFTWVSPELGTAAKTRGLAPEAAARKHLGVMLDDARLGAEAARTLVNARVDALPGGASIVRLEPRLDGIPIFHEEIALLMDGARQLVALRGPLPRTAPSEAKSLARFSLDAREAIAAALAAHDFAPSVALEEVRADGEYFAFRPGRAAKSASGAIATEPQRARRVWFRTVAGLEPAWYVETSVAEAPDAAPDLHAHVIAAGNGRLLFRLDLVAHATEHSYRVYAEPTPLGLPYPTPYGRALTPDPDGLPTNDSAQFVPSERRTLSSAPFSRSATDPWLAPGASVTSGNNVNAYADLVAPSGFGAGDLQPTTTSLATFDYPFDPTIAPGANATQTSAAVVQAFYVVNWLHDWFYDHGFGEDDGSAQVDNYGRGGIGADPILAEAQDYNSSGANITVPADGGSPRMQLPIVAGTPGTDTALVSPTIAHEWGHYLAHRLVGNSSGLFTQHARGLGEGWSDFVSLLVMVKDEDRAKPGNDRYQGAYGRGYTSHTYYGVRRYPYSTDPSKNPLRMEHLANGTALPTAPAPRSGANGANNTEVHAQGEIWASALWDGYANLLNDRPRLSFDEAQRRMKDYLVASLKLTPIAPTIVEARDALLAVVLASGATEDYALFAAAFAKRGIGAGAQVPDRYSTTMAGVVQSTSSGAHVSVLAVDLAVPQGCDADAVLDEGETSLLTLTVSNSGFSPIPSGTIALATSHAGLRFPGGATVTLPALPLGARRSIQVPVTLSPGLAPNTSIRVTAMPTVDGAAAPGFAATTDLRVNFDQAARTSSVEEFDGAYTDWRNARAPFGTGVGAWTLVDQPVRHLHGSDGNAYAVTWIETPPMSVGAGPLVVTLNHRYAFEGGDRLYDGGVIQASVDGGATWTDVDPIAAGFDVPLSDCCGNPLGGKRAYSETSPGYPNFSERTIDFGTAYANRRDFRLRFGVATDSGISRNGWDIDRVGVAGLSDTPFASVVPHAASCELTTHRPLQGAMSGTYATPSRSGEGVLVDFGRLGGTPVVFFSWYTYDHGHQQWLVGSNVFDPSSTSVAIDVVNTRGTDFGSRFRPEDVVRMPWGSVSLTFPTCDTMVLTYRKSGGEVGVQTLSRGFERRAAAECPAQGGPAGTYYAETRAGEGVLLDVGNLGGAPYEFLAWYTYQGGMQHWLVGSRPYVPNERSVLDLFQTEGASFGGAFQTREVRTTPWGKVTRRFVDCDTLELAYEKSGGESGTITLKRGLERLGDGLCR